MKKVLLTTVQKPMGCDNEHVLAELFHAQITHSQGLFSLRSVCNGWGLEFIANNLKSPITVLHYPSERFFRKVLKKGYDYVGINLYWQAKPGGTSAEGNLWAMLAHSQLSFYNLSWNMVREFTASENPDEVFPRKLAPKTATTMIRFLELPLPAQLAEGTSRWNHERIVIPDSPSS